MPRLTRRTFSLGVAGSAAAIAMPHVARAQEVTLKLHQFLPTQANVPKFVLEPWIKKVQDESGGRIKIEHYPAMQLGGKPPELIDQATDGTVDIVWTLPGNTPGRFPSTEVFELPFTMTNAEATSKAYWDLFDKYMKDTEFKDQHIIGAWVHGPGVVHSKEPVNKLEDMSGKKIRAPTRVINQLLGALGATPVGMPVPQITDALSKGVIDGCVIPWEVTTSLKVPELVNNHTEFSGDHALYTTTFVLAMNKPRYESLPDDLKKVIDANGGQAYSAWAGKTQASTDAPSKKIAVDRGNSIITLDQAEVDRWKTAAQPVIDNWVKDVTGKGLDGQKLLDEARASIEQYSKG